LTWCDAKPAIPTRSPTIVVLVNKPPHVFGFQPVRRNIGFADAAGCLSANRLSTAVLALFSIRANEKARLANVADASRKPTLRPRTRIRGEKKASTAVDTAKKPD